MPVELTYVQAVILGVVEGLTEFLPISSSAHVRVVGELMNPGEDPGAAFTAIIQLGTNLRFGRLAAELEAELAKPVWAVGTVIYWHALRAMGIQDQSEGFGTLLAKH